MKDNLLHQIGLTLIEGVGDVNAKALLSYCGSAEEVFRQKKSHLMKIPGIGEIIARSVSSGAGVLKRAEEELRFISRYKIKPLFYTDEDYPGRLKSCSDGPVMMYFKGTADLNCPKIVGIVGTRKPSSYGIEKTSELVSGLEESGVMVLSGLAFGIDVVAHKAALEHNMDTVGVLAHGLDRLYPQSHESIARRMLKKGGLLTDFMSATVPDAVNFPKRNRIVAGLCDALIVMESKRTGGSLITATIASSYNKDVFAYPGRAGEALSEGCNGLIKRNKAALIESAADLLDAMQWTEVPRKKSKQKQIPLLLALSDDEKTLMNIFSQKPVMHLDEICSEARLPVSKVSAILLQLEFSNLVKSKPGKVYEAA